MQALYGYVPDLNGNPTVLPARFYWKEKKVSDNPPNYEKVAYICIHHLGGNDTTDRPATDNDKKNYYRQWDAFERNEKQEDIGWSLSQCPFLDVAQVATYKAREIRTMEQLATAPDSAVAGILGAVEHRKKAKLMLKQATDAKPVFELEAKLKQRDDEVDLLKAQIAELCSEMDKLKDKKSK